MVISQCQVLVLMCVIGYLQFTKESANTVDEVKLRVIYISPPQPPSPVPEGSEEGSSPRAFASDNTTQEFGNVSV